MKLSTTLFVLNLIESISMPRVDTTVKLVYRDDLNQSQCKQGRLDKARTQKLIQFFLSLVWEQVVEENERANR